MSDTVAIVGGGVSGLAAAVRLVCAGVPVVVYEARGTLGGRATSFADPQTGEVFDNGQHALMGCYLSTFAFLAAIDSMTRVTVQPRLSLSSVDEAGAVLPLECPDWPSPLHLLGGVLGWAGVAWPDRLDVLAMAPALWRARRAAFGPDRSLPCRPDETVDAWLTRHHQGPRIRTLLWDPLAVAALNQDPRRAAATTFVRVLGRVFGPGRTDASLALPSAALSDVFANPAEAFLSARGVVIHRHALARVVVGRDRVERIEVRGTPAPARQAVVATPWHTWPTVVVGEVAPVSETLAAAAATAASPIVTVTLTYDRPVIDRPILGLPGRPLQWVFDTTALGGARPGTRVALVSSGADDILRQSNEQLTRLAHATLASGLPRVAREAALVGSRVVREPKATFSLAPGQPRRPGTRSGIRGLYFASDWVDTGLPATIEGAVEAGHRAAAAVLGDR